MQASRAYGIGTGLNSKRRQQKIGFLWRISDKHRSNQTFYLSNLLKIVGSRVAPTASQRETTLKATRQMDQNHSSTPFDGGPPPLPPEYLKSHQNDLVNSYSIRKRMFRGVVAEFECLKCGSDLFVAAIEIGRSDKCAVCGHEFRLATTQYEQYLERLKKEEKERDSPHQVDASREGLSMTELLVLFGGVCQEAR